MAVPAGPTEQRYVGNGVSTIYAVPFLVIQASDLAVYVDGVKLTSGYTQSGVGNTTSSVIFAVAPSYLSLILFILEFPFERLNDYQENGDFLARTVNNDFDRIWQALKQLYTWATRSLRLGTTDVDGQGWYRAKNNGIRDLRNPVENQDAVTKLYNEQYIAGLLSQFSGPINNANNVMLVYPDGVARPVQTLATKNDQLLGSAGIAHNNGTVRDALVTLANSDATQNTQIQTNTDAIAGIGRVFSNVLDPAVIDLHFGPLCGTGWAGASEPGAIVSTTTTASAAQNTTALAVASAASFFVGQLICWLSSDGQYDTGVIKIIEAGPVLRMDRQMRVAVASGAPVYNFNRDDAHANTYGFNAIADSALRQLTAKRIPVLEYRANDGAIWSPILGATLVSQTASVYTNPGGGAVGERSISVASPTVGAGASSSWVALTGGDKVVNLVLNPGTRDPGNLSGSVDIAVWEKLADGTEFQIASDTGILSYGAIRSRDIDFTIRPGSMVQIRVTSPNGGPWTFYLGQLSYYSVRGFLSSLNRGRHVLLGDSWFAGGDLYNRLVARLPKATIINKGVSGNKASDLLARFGTDVVPQSPDFVWIMIGTNDYYASVSPALFEQQILQLRRLIQSLGAQPIFFTASVGAIAPTAGGGDQLVKSRSYALNVRYTGQALQPDAAGTVQRSSNFYARPTVGAASSQIIGVLPGNTRLPVLIRYLHQSVAGLQLSIEYCATADGTGAVDVSTFTGVGPFKDQPAARASTDLRFVVIRATNPSGSGITATIIADICWSQSLV